MRSRCRSVIVGVWMIALSACRQSGRQVEELSGGNPLRGALAITSYGCGSCHVVKGINSARGLVGPPLTGVGSRLYLAGVLQNTPENMAQWIRDPLVIDDKTVMPNLGVTAQDAIDITAYLYSLK